MAVVNLWMWHGLRHRCSECGAEGYPRECGCPGRRHAIFPVEGAYVQDWIEWIVYHDIVVKGHWPAARLEHVVHAERSLSDP